MVLKVCLSTFRVIKINIDVHNIWWKHKHTLFSHHPPIPWSLPVNDHLKCHWSSFITVQRILYYFITLFMQVLCHFLCFYWFQVPKLSQQQAHIFDNNIKSYDDISPCDKVLSLYLLVVKIRKNVDCGDGLPTFLFVCIDRTLLKR